jgi:hypothetical protein
MIIAVIGRPALAAGYTSSVKFQRTMKDIKQLISKPMKSFAGG